MFGRSSKRSAEEYDSAFEGESFLPSKKRHDGPSSSKMAVKDPILQPKAQSFREGVSTKGVKGDLSRIAMGPALRYYQSSLTAYDRHKLLINQYLLYHPGATELLKRDSSKDVRDMDVVRQHHQFLWDSTDQTASWEQQLAKKYYDKLFKEYCICDLSRYTENKIGMRWRTADEVKNGKGQFVCGNKKCDYNCGLKSWEMNFAYLEKGVKKNALVKVRLCEACSLKLNFCHKRREVVKKKKRTKKLKKTQSVEDLKDGSNEGSQAQEHDEQKDEEDPDSQLWKGPSKILEEESKEEQFDDYLEDLLL